MPTILSCQEFDAMTERCRRRLRQLKLRKNTKPRSAEKTQALIQSHINCLKRNFPRLCRDGYYRFPYYIRELAAKGEIEKLPDDWPFTI